MDSKTVVDAIVIIAISTERAIIDRLYDHLHRQTIARIDNRNLTKI